MLNDKPFYLGMLVIWCSVIFLFTEISYFSGDHTALVIEKLIYYTPINTLSPEVQDTKSAGLSTINYVVRKLAHMIVFGILAFLIWKLIYPKRFSYLTAWIFTIVYAALDEWHQSFIPWRSAHFSDVMIDSLAAFIILMIIFKTKKKIRILILL